MRLRSFVVFVLVVSAGLAALPLPAATIAVTTTADDITPNDGSVSLREAITAVNAGNTLGDPDINAQAPGTFGTNDTINFNIPGAGVKTIAVGSSASALGIPLPAITKPVIIDGYSQPSSSQNTLNQGDNAVLLIELDGTSAGGSVNGLTVSGVNSTIKGLVINRFSGGKGIELSNSGNTVSGNFVGTNPSGVSQSGAGSAANFVGIDTSSQNNVIGGTSPADRNIVSGNFAAGISINSSAASGNIVEGNYVGTNSAGTAAIPNFQGVFIFGFNNTIGGTTAGARNLISGNGANSGIQMTGHVVTTGNVVEGNYIGVNFLGVAALPNTAAGIFLNGVSGNTIGGTAPGAGNVISGNSTAGIDIRTNSNANLVQGNLIGTDQSGINAIPNLNLGIDISIGSSSNTIGGTVAGAGNTIAYNSGGAGVRVQVTSTGNAILRNFIFSNAGLGIDLNADGVTANDALDADTGANNLQNYPVLTSVVSGSNTLVSGTLNSTPNTTFRVEFFSNASCDSSGHGEGQTFSGFTTVTTDGSGNATFSATLPILVAPGQVITATATDPSNNTSEFSSCQAVVASSAIPALAGFVLLAMALFLGGFGAFVLKMR